MAHELRITPVLARPRHQRQRHSATRRHQGLARRTCRSASLRRYRLQR